MDKIKILLPAFILIALLQIYIPAQMILEKEDVIKSGKEFKFKTAPIDPNDPLRGKYISLNFEENFVEVRDVEEWESGESINVLLGTDEAGFAKLLSGTKEIPPHDQDFLKAKVRYISADNKLSIDLPFNRFYMNESKAPGAERIYSRSLRDSSRVTYALVSIKNGDAVLKDVFIDKVSIRELAEE